jgi:hypothetical protein
MLELFILKFLNQFKSKHKQNEKNIRETRNEKPSIDVAHEKTQTNDRSGMGLAHLRDRGRNPGRGPEPFHRLKR